MRRGLKSPSMPDDQEHGVDVGRDDLLFGGIAGGAAGKAAGSRQHGANPRVGARGRRLDRDPVAHGWKIATRAVA